MPRKLTLLGMDPSFRNWGLALGELDDVVQGGGRDRVAAEVDLRAVGGLVVVQTLDSLYHSAGAEVRSADADNYKYLGILLYLLCDGLYSGELFLVIVDGKVDPAEERIACARAVMKLFMSGGYLRLNSRELSGIRRLADKRGVKSD